MNNIELHIEKLVLHGFKPGDRHRIGQAVELELTRMLTEQGLPLSLVNNEEFAQLNGGTFNMSPNSRPETIGSQVAQSVYRGFKK
ncbi:MAG: hypothetical protein KAJ93_08680 [Methanosarcinales archaeon]|nr:hypothetical protein [Methanosarcinales archaeon]